MAKSGIIPSADAWKELTSEVTRLRSEIRNSRTARPNPRSTGGGTRMIRFTLLEELRRGQTKTATHVPWKTEGEITDLIVIDDPISPLLTSEQRAPIGCGGKAIKTRLGWVIIHLDCAQILPIDGDIQV